MMQEEVITSPHPEQASPVGEGEATATEAKISVLSEEDIPLHDSEESVEKRYEENFPVASWLVPGGARDAIVALYSFARHVDDIADDGALPADYRLKKLQRVEDILTGKYRGSPKEWPQWLMNYFQLLAQGKMARRHGLALLKAFKQDVTMSRYETLEELLDYCQHSAAPVGRAVLELCGEHYANIAASDALCIALQLINHIQDISEDWQERQRIYLPSEIGGAGEEAVIQSVKDGASSDAVHDTCQKLLDEVERQLVLSADLPESLQSMRLRMEIVTVMNVAMQLLVKLRKYDPIATSVALTKSEKKSALLSAIFRGLWTGFDGGKHHEKPKVMREAIKKSSFFIGMRQLPSYRREGIFRLYSFCRMVDDVADSGIEKPVALNALTQWEMDLEVIYSKQLQAYPRHPVSRALLPVVDGFSLPKKQFDELFQGITMDIEGEMLRPAWPDLMRYCHCVAGTVGVLSTRIFGCRHESSEKAAIALGKGLQLVNILRDVREDARRSRVYLPKELLAKHDALTLSLGHLVRKPYPAPIQKTMVELAERAEQFFVDFDQHAQKEASFLAPAMTMKHSYQQLLGKLRREW